MNRYREQLLILMYCLISGCSEGPPQTLPAASTNRAPDATALVSPANANTAGATRLENDRASDQTHTDSGLSVKIVLDATSDEPAIRMDQTFEVVLTNHSDQPIHLWNISTKNGYYQLSFEFVSERTGKTYTASKRLIDDDRFWPNASNGDDSNSDEIIVLPSASATFYVELGGIAWGKYSWKGLPTPNTGDRYQMRALFASPDGPDAKRQRIWAGKLRSEPFAVKVFDSATQTVHDYLRKGYPDAVIEMMEADPKMIHSRDDNRCTPLHLAADFGYVSVVQWLLDHDADVNALAYNNFTPLHLSEDPEVVQLLLQKRPKMATGIGHTPLQRASYEQARAVGTKYEQKWRDVVQQYMAAGVEIDLLTAIHLDSLEHVKAILKKSPELVDDVQRHSPLRAAASLGRLQICRHLVENYKVDVDDFRGGGGFPIIKESVRYPEIVKLLIAHGADLNTRITMYGFRTGHWVIGDDASILHYAASDGVPETIRVLIDSGVDIFATATVHGRDDDEQYALEVAASFGKGDNAEAVVNHPKFDAAHKTVRQSLLDKCLVIGASGTSEQRAKLAQVLLDKGANPDAMYKERTALQAATRAVHPTMVEENAETRKVATQLIAHGATLDLVSAIAFGYEEEVARMLMSDPQLANSCRLDGYPALHIAVGMNDVSMVQLLLKSGIDVDIRNQSDGTGSRNGTALHCAAFWGREKIAALLIDAGADVNALAIRNATPLHEAARLGNRKVAKLFLTRGANPNALDTDKRTPLDICRRSHRNQSKEMEEMFREFGAKSTAEIEAEQ